MSNDRVVHMVRPRGRTLAVVIALMAPIAGGLAEVSPALAGERKEPTGIFADFAQCPRFTTGVNLCLYSQMSSGVMAIGRAPLAVVNPVIVQGGIAFDEATDTETFVGALDGETISRTPQPVPGGLPGLIGCEEITGRGRPQRALRSICRAVLQDPRLTALTATTELARPAGEIAIDTSNEVNGKGTALSLPLRIHLENPLLGRECYVGTGAEPVTVNLTSGTTNPPEPNKPISGEVGDVTTQDAFNFFEITGNTLVDNTFAVPPATSCGAGFLSSILNPLIDTRLGLPSPAGYNTLIQNNTVKEATTTSVIESEQPTPPTEPPTKPHKKWDHTNEESSHTPEGSRHRH
jgi:hypothetical protein